MPDAVIHHRIQVHKLRRSYFLDLHYRQGRMEGARKRADDSRIPPLYLYPQVARAYSRAMALRISKASSFPAAGNERSLFHRLHTRLDQGLGLIGLALRLPWIGRWKRGGSAAKVAGFPLTVAAVPFRRQGGDRVGLSEARAAYLTRAQGVGAIDGNSSHVMSYFTISGHVIPVIRWRIQHEPFVY